MNKQDPVSWLFLSLLSATMSLLLLGHILRVLFCCFFGSDACVDAVRQCPSSIISCQPLRQFLLLL